MVAIVNIRRCRYGFGTDLILWELQNVKDGGKKSDIYNLSSVESISLQFFLAAKNIQLSSRSWSIRNMQWTILINLYNLRAQSRLQLEGHHLFFFLQVYDILPPEDFLEEDYLTRAMEESNGTSPIDCFITGILKLRPDSCLKVIDFTGFEKGILSWSC